MKTVQTSTVKLGNGRATKPAAKPANKFSLPEAKLGTPKQGPSDVQYELVEQDGKQVLVIAITLKDEPTPLEKNGVVTSYGLGGLPYRADTGIDIGDGRTIRMANGAVYVKA